MDKKIELILEQLYAIKDDDKFYFMSYGKDWIEDLCGVTQRLVCNCRTWEGLNEDGNCYECNLPTKEHSFKVKTSIETTK